MDPPGDTGSEVSDDVKKRAPAVGEASSAEEDAGNLDPPGDTGSEDSATSAEEDAGNMERWLWTCVGNLMAAMNFPQNTSLRYSLWNRM